METGLISIPFQDIIDGRHRNRVIGRAGAAVDRDRTRFALRRLRQLFVKRLDEFAPTNGQKEFLEPRIRGLIPITD